MGRHENDGRFQPGSGHGGPYGRVVEGRAAGPGRLVMQRSGIAVARVVNGSGVSEWTDGIADRDKTPNLSAEGVLTLARKLAGLQQPLVLPDQLPPLLSEVHEGAAAFPSPSAEVAAADLRHPDRAGYFC